VTNTDLPSEKVVIAYAKRSSREKRGNAVNYINTLKGHREAKVDWYAPSRSDKGYGRWASFTKILWGKRAIFQWMMLSYNLFLLFKLDFLGISEFRQQITCACGTGAGKTFCLKVVFLAGIIIRTARTVVMKLPAKYPFRDVYEKCMT
jgi:hypothetical protein